MTLDMENTLSFGDYLVIAKRRIWYVLIPFVVVVIAAVTVINVLPPVYRSTATVAVESQQIPQDLVQSTVVAQAGERISFVQQRIMTSARLLQVIDKYDLYSDIRDQTPQSVLVAKLREHIFLDTVRDRSIQRRNVSNTVAFTLAVEHGDPETAAAVANELVTMFLAENIKTRTARATETTEFLKREAMRVSEQVAAIESRIAAFKEEHSETLPEHLDLRMNILQTSETALKETDREIAAAEEERRFLETQRTSVGAILSAGSTGDGPAMSPAQQLAVLRVEFTEKSAVYAPAHPDLRSLKRRIALLERAVDATSASSDEQQVTGPMDPATAQIDSQIASTTARLASLRDQKQGLQRKIEQVQAKIVATPQVEKGLKGLARDYESAITEYEDISAKHRDAELAENLEQGEKAERFVLLEPPEIPSVPVWPEKLQLYAIGFVLAVGSGAGTALFAEFLDTTIRGPAMLTSILQRHPVAVIPFIECSRDRHRTRLRRMWILLAAFLLLATALAITHLLYQPLDTLIDSLLEAIGLK